MMTVSVHEAKTQLSKLLELLEEGEEIVIARHGRPVARLVRAKSAAKLQFDACGGEFSWEEGWERPLSPRETDAFWQGRLVACESGAPRKSAATPSRHSHNK
jgi:prevent-host-death family protein